MIRLTGGEWRGRAIQVPDDPRTRPTQSMLRQAMFNSIQGYVEGTRVLDLFAGSGALGFEALSRGAAHCTFVEKARSVAKLISKNAATLGCEDRVRVLELDSTAFRLAQVREPFDLVLCDPPYGNGFELKMLELGDWGAALTPEGFILMESAVRDGELPQEVGVLSKVREKAYGDTLLTTYRRSL